MRIFVACPVRFADPGFLERVRARVHKLEGEGHVVYWPPRDTNQELAEIQICGLNQQAVKSCDEVHVAWDGRSEGVLFDLGMAFALGKPVRRMFLLCPPRTVEKSFANFLLQLDQIVRGEALTSDA